MVMPGVRAKKPIPIVPGVVPSRKVTRIKVINVYMPSADTEYIWQLPIGLKSFTLQVRDGTAIRIAVERDRVASLNGPYFTLKAGMAWDEDDLNVQDESSFLYFACSSTSKVIEIIAGIEEE